MGPPDGPTNENAFIWQRRIYYDDTDAGGVVYHSNYLTLMEQARTEWLRHLGYEQRVLIEEDTLFAVTHIDVRFLAPARLDDMVDVTVQRPITVRPVRLILHQTIQRPNGEKILIDATVQIACISTSFRPKKIPKPMLERMQPWI
ncbi:MAG: YbgC/FadM family acyl-CoA thioesterase [Magnetococcales bacterium]|nr:YbgC/FadM family acyl-CoA thioesterase [Magnetococcales bacterium]